MTDPLQITVDVSFHRYVERYVIKYLKEMIVMQQCPYLSAYRPIFLGNEARNITCNGTFRRDDRRNFLISLRIDGCIAPDKTLGIENIFHEIIIILIRSASSSRTHKREHTNYVLF